MYTLDYIVTRVYGPNGLYVDLEVDEFKVIPQNVYFETHEEAEQERIRLTAEAKDGFYRVVPMETCGEF
jgi:hypothetical protein